MKKIVLLLVSLVSLTILGAGYSPLQACSIHDHGCRYHGSGLQVLPNGIDPTLNGADGLVAVLGWNNTNDLDIHGLLPDGNGAYNATGSGRTGSSTPGGDSNGDPRLGEPFIGAGEHDRHIYYSQYDLSFQGGNALAYITGDVSGGSANPHPACSIQGTTSCEAIAIVGSTLPQYVPFTFQAYNFNDLNASANPSTDFSLRAYATGRYYIVNQSHVDQGVQGTLANTEDSSNQLEVILGQRQSDAHAIGVNLDYTGRQPQNATERQLQMFQTITAQDVQIIEARRQEKIRQARLAAERRQMGLVQVAAHQNKINFITSLRPDASQNLQYFPQQPTRIGIDSTFVSLPTEQQASKSTLQQLNTLNNLINYTQSGFLTLASRNHVFGGTSIQKPLRYITDRLPTITKRGIWTKNQGWQTRVLKEWGGDPTTWSGTPYKNSYSLGGNTFSNMSDLLSIGVESYNAVEAFNDEKYFEGTIATINVAAVVTPGLGTATSLAESSKNFADAWNSDSIDRNLEIAAGGIDFITRGAASLAGGLLGGVKGADVGSDVAEVALGASKKLGNWIGGTYYDWHNGERDAGILQQMEAERQEILRKRRERQTSLSP